MFSGAGCLLALALCVLRVLPASGSHDPEEPGTERKLVVISSPQPGQEVKTKVDFEVQHGEPLGQHSGGILVDADDPYLLSSGGIYRFCRYAPHVLRPVGVGLGLASMACCPLGALGQDIVCGLGAGCLCGALGASGYDLYRRNNPFEALQERFPDHTPFSGHVRGGCLSSGRNAGTWTDYKEEATTWSALHERGGRASNQSMGACGCDGCSLPFNATAWGLHWCNPPTPCGNPCVCPDYCLGDPAVWLPLAHTCQAMSLAWGTAAWVLGLWDLWNECHTVQDEDPAFREYIVLRPASSGLGQPAVTRR